jgi:hypothetical protein
MTDDFARAAASYYGGLDEPAPQDGTLFLSAKGIQFVWGRRQNKLGRFVGEEKQIFIRPDEIVDVATEVERSSSFAATMMLGVAGIGASKLTASLVVKLADRRVAVFALYGVTSPQLIGALSRFGLYHRKVDNHDADTQAAPLPDPPTVTDFADQLRKLAALRDDGLITDAEYETQKARLLDPAP